MLNGMIRICIRTDKTNDDHKVIGHEYKTKLTPVDQLKKRLGRSGFQEFTDFKPVRYEGHGHVTLS
jgi:hypothetical protein